jgi:ribosomal protein L7Ae-like RNA K-turn-binding protein
VKSADGNLREQVPTDSPRSRALQWIGLGVRARKAVVGGDAVMKAIRSKSATLVVVAADTGTNMAKKYRDKCAFYQVPLYVAFSRTELGSACGRGQTAAVAFTDAGFAAKMRQLVGENSGGEAFGETSGL